jgi:hypothetical protein
VAQTFRATATFARPKIFAGQRYQEHLAKTHTPLRLNLNIAAADLNYWHRNCV